MKASGKYFDMNNTEKSYRRRRCPNTGKLAFKNKKAAIAGISRLRNSLDNILDSVEFKAKSVYRCPLCNLWHITSQGD